MKKQQVKIITYVIAGFMAVLLSCLSIQTAYAEKLENPFLVPTEPFYTTDEEGNWNLWIGEPDRTRSAAVTHWPDSKKGLQENDYLLDTDYQSLGVKQILLNIVMNDCIEYQDGEYHLVNKNYVSAYRPFVRRMNAEGVTVSLVILMRWDQDPNIQRLIYQGGREAGHSFYELNTQDALGKQAWTNIFGELVSTFGQEDCHIDHFILGNEVNQTGSGGYNYTGSYDLTTNANAYADAFVILEHAIKQYSPTGRAFISLDHNWMASDTGHPGKYFLDAFILALAQRDYGAGWNVAWHPYAPSLRSTINTSMDSLLIWNSAKVTNDLNTKYICGSNLTVLTDYIRGNWGSDHRVILSEQGFDASGDHDDWQAAFWAYTFYAAQYNDMVDAVIFRAYIDNPDEDGLKFGLLSGSVQELYNAGDRRAYIEEHKRVVYDVFKYMDTEFAAEYTVGCLNTIGAGAWDELIAAYTGPPALRDGWINSQDGYKCFLVNGVKVTGWQIIEGSTYYFDDQGRMLTGAPVINGKKYLFDSSGRQMTGWLYFLGAAFYFDPADNGAAAVGLRNIEGTLYCFDENGVQIELPVGIFEIDGKRYYITGNLMVFTGWLQITEDWRLYFDPSEGGAAAVGFRNINGKVYYFDINGIMLRSVALTIDGKKYLFGDGGEAYTGWIQLTPYWRLYYDPAADGAAAVGLKTIKGSTYYFDVNGIMLKSAAVTMGDKKYLFGDSGEAYTGWIQLTYYWRLYYDPEMQGAAATGFKKIDGKVYYFDENGIMQTQGMPVINGKKYLVLSDGSLFMGWIQLSPEWRLYYDPNDNGAAATSERIIDGISYLFNSDGVLIG